MSAIAGVFGAPDRATVQAMLDVLRHRGPDDCHLVVGDDFVLGARGRRSGPADGTAARTPLVHQADAVWAALDGEVLNRADLRPLLERSRRRLSSGSDVELLAPLYEQQGLDFCRWLDGKMAAALYDTRLRRGVLVRDRFGKKPLFTHRVDGRLYFASEIKALSCVPGFDRQVRIDAVNHFLALEHVPGPGTIFAGIDQVPPAHALVWQADRGVELRRYWTPDFTPGSRAEPWSDHEACDLFLDLLRTAVQRRLSVDAPTGFLLGGGLASSLVTALAAESSPRRIQTFTLVDPDIASTAAGERRRQWASWVAQHHGAEHHEASFEAVDFPSQVREVLSHLDQPFAGGLTANELGRFAARHVSVAMSGAGADELFGGRLARRLASTPPADPSDRLRVASGIPDWRWRSRLAVFDDDERLALFHPDIADQLHVSRTDLWWRDQFERSSAIEPLQRVLEAEFRTLLPDQVLTVVDRLSMAHSLEVRAPYLDTRLVEFVCRLPAPFKVRGDAASFLVEKAAERYFPAAMVRAETPSPLAPPERRPTPFHRSYVRDTLSPSRLARHGYFQPQAVDRLLAQLDQPSCVDDALLAKVRALVVFQEWHDMVVEAARQPVRHAA